MSKNNRKPKHPAGNCFLEIEKQLAGLARKNVGKLPGHFIKSEVAHDHWCAFQRGKGVCNCDPDVTLTVIELDEVMEEFSLLDDEGEL